jgi:hypothetical protein
MKKLTLLLGLVLVAGTAAAQQDSGSTTTDPGLISSDEKVRAKTEDKSDKKKEASVQGAEVISVDASSKTITVKEAGAASASAAVPGTMTLSVQGKAVSTLKDIKAGDFVDLTCKADSNKKADVSATASGTTATASVKTDTSAAGTLSECASVTAITKAVGSAYSSTSTTTTTTSSSSSSPSSISSSIPSASASASTSPSSSSVGSPGGSMTTDSSTASTSSSIAQGGTLSPDQATVEAEVKQRASQPAPPATSSSTTTTTTDTTVSTSSSTTGSAKLTAVVVSTDPASKTITVRNPGQGKSTASASESTLDSLTLPVEGKAGSKLADFKAGDRVAITCRESATSGSTSMSGSSSAIDTAWSSAGRCAAVTEIAKAKASASEADPASSKAKTTTEPQPQPKTY